jgi:hypothetical protein
MQEPDWQERMHRSLDVLSKDYATGPEIRSVWPQVLHPDTVRALENQERTAERMRTYGPGVVKTITHDGDFVWACESEGLCYCSAT